jgi:hypothetical protein
MSVRIMLSSWEPPIEIEPMTYALRGACALTAHALAAPMAPVIALMALAALGLSDDPVHEPVHARASAPVILLLCVILPRTLYPRTRAGPARHELTVFQIAVKYSSRAMSGADVRRSQSPRPRRDELPGRAGPRLTIQGMSALRWRASVSHARDLSARDTC